MIDKDPCGSCGSIEYYWWKGVITVNDEYVHRCSDCSKDNMPQLSPDVYFDSSKGSNQIDPNLCDRKGGPIPFSSKREKAAIMKRLGVREAGDAVHGGRNWDKKASKQWDK